METKLDVLFEELVPASGKADTVAGEIVRAITRIGYRNWNDGDHLGVGYGRETCNPAGRYLAAKCNAKVDATIADIWGLEDDDLYDCGLSKLENAVVEFLEQYPELKETANREDMWDYRNPLEDVDVDGEEEWR